jgi:hypothetical protein
MTSSPIPSPASSATDMSAANVGGRLKAVAITAFVGGPLFLVGTILHPARDGHGVAAAGQLYGITHDLQAIGLLLQAVALVGLLASVPRLAWRLWPWYAALIGTLSWFGLIMYDGAHNPVTARYAPDLVHTPADLDAGGAIVVLPALLLFPFGYAFLGAALDRHGRRWTGVLLGAGAVVYTVGGLLIFAIGPSSSLIQITEVAGAAPYALAFVLLGRARLANVDSA